MTDTMTEITKLIMSNKYYLQFLKRPAACRSADLRARGITPADATAIPKQLNVHKPSTVIQDTPDWSFVPGNRPENAVLVERGAFSDAGNATPFFFRSLNPATLLYEWHTVWHLGLRWYCRRDFTRAVPDVLSSGWSVVDSFEGLKVEIEMSETSQGRWLRPHVFGGQSGDEIMPISTIPATGRWEKLTVCEDQCTLDDHIFNEAHTDTTYGVLITEADLNVERDYDGNIIHAPESVTFSFILRMEIGGPYKSRLYDANRSALSDSTDDPLYTSETLYPQLLTDSEGNSYLSTRDIPTATYMEVRGSVTFSDFN